MSDACCPPGSWGVPLSEPNYLDLPGSLNELGEHKLPTYYAAPDKPSKKGIMIFPDIHGASNLLTGYCDIFASHGYHCIMLDTFRGDKCSPLTPEFKNWVGKFPYDPVVKRDIDECFTFFAEKGVDRGQVGALGFCWGVWALIKANSEGVPFRCGVGPHPSTRLERMGYDSDEREVVMYEKVNMPVLLMPAENDPESVKPGGKLTTIIEGQGGKSIAFENMKHGFSSRGDMSDPEVKKQAEACLQHALEFFNEKM